MAPVVCFVTTPPDRAGPIAQALVERELAACVNVLPGVRSFYRWKGALQRDDERLLVIKTRAELFEELREALVALHPYELPEVVALPVSAGHAPYRDWIGRGTGAAGA